MIAVGGENLIDYVQTSFKGNLPVYTASPGGSCYNVALAIARQNQPVKYMTPISKDSLGNILADRLIADGVLLGAPRSDAPTSLAIVSINDGQPKYQFYRTETAERQISEHLFDSVFERTVKIFHIGSLALIEGKDASFWEKKFSVLADNGVITSLDPNTRSVAVKDKASYVSRLTRMMGNACVLKLSDEDLVYIIPDMTTEDAFNQLCATTGATLVILTCGADGATIRTKNQQFKIKATLARPLRDTIGAGDTFMGTILAELYKRRLQVGDIGLLNREELKKIAERATLAAALNCQTIGCNPPYLQEF